MSIGRIGGKFIKIVRINGESGAEYGVLENDTVRTLRVSPFDEEWNINAPVFTGRKYNTSKIKFMVPCEPTKYIGVGLNFESAAAAMNRPCPDYPITFIKPTGAIIGDGDYIVLPRNEECFLYEGELAVVIGRKASKVKAADAEKYILGYTCSNDVTDKGFFGKDDLKLKAADTFGPVGPCISTDVNPSNCVIRSWVNGEQRQEGNTSEMKFTTSYMVEFLSSYMTLYPGDIISMGTPAGIGNIRPGDKICIEVEGIGKLNNTVRI